MCDALDSIFGSKPKTAVSTETLAPLDKSMRTVAGNRALDLVNQTYPGYDYRKRTAPFSGGQQDAFSRIRDYATSPINVQSERIVDEGGRLGKVGDYMSPFLTASLTPTIREMRESGKMQRMGIGDTAVVADAYGDARHGIAEAEQMRGETEAIGDFTSRAHESAYQDSMNRRAGDLDRFISTDMLRDQMMNSRLLQLLGIGDREQQLDQFNRDAEYSEFRDAREWPFRQYDAILEMLSRTGPTTQTATEEGGNNSWLMQLIGALGGSLLPG